MHYLYGAPLAAKAQQVLLWRVLGENSAANEGDMRQGRGEPPVPVDYGGVLVDAV